MSPKAAYLISKLKTLNWPLLFGVLFFIATVVASWHAVVGLQTWLAKENNSKITKVIVQGKPNYTMEHEIVAKIKQTQLNTFFDVDVNKVQESVLTLPWVAQVSVRKQWPDTIKVYIVEHQAVAVWNQDLLLNQAGEVFEAKADEFFETLPMLYGPEGSEVEAWQTYKKFDELFVVQGLKLKSLALSERYSWQLWLENGIRLNLGRKNKVERAQRFIDIYPHIKNSQEEEIDVVDLRYDTGLAVSWKQPQQAEQQQKSKV